MSIVSKVGQEMKNPCVLLAGLTGSGSSRKEVPSGISYYDVFRYLTVHSGVFHDDYIKHYTWV